MRKILWVAWREFLATVATKGFIIGVLITPAMIAALIVLMPILINEKPPKIDGELAVIDPSGEVAEGVRNYLAPGAIADRWAESKKELREQVQAKTPEPVRGLTRGSEAIADQALDSMLGDVPEIHVVALPAGADVTTEKEALRLGTAQDGGRLALAVVHPDAIHKLPDKKAYGNYDLYVRGKLDDRIEDEVKGGLRKAIVTARIRSLGLDPSEVEALTKVERVRSTTVTEKGEQETNEIANFMLPAGFMILLLVAVFTSGQSIMTTTIEEKSNRVVEVLLSAVSPMQLMTGKIIGQMTVGLVILVLYAGMGIAGLVSLAMLGAVDPTLFLYLILFYLISYFIMGGILAAIGAAVNEMREAQTLMTPVMLTMMVPWLLWMPITRDPNSVFATVASFLPPINTYVMLLRMTSSTPPPMWQVWLTILIGLATVYATLWAAAKVFRIGLLMYGKPPNFATLIRWVRMA